MIEWTSSTAESLALLLANLVAIMNVILASLGISSNESSIPGDETPLVMPLT